VVISAAIIITLGIGGKVRARPEPVNLAEPV